MRGPRSRTARSTARGLYRALLREAAGLARDVDATNVARGARHVVRGGATTLLATPQARLLEKHALARARVFPQPFTAAEAAFRRDITLTAGRDDGGGGGDPPPLHLMDAITDNPYRPVLPELPIHHQIKHLVRAGARQQEREASLGATTMVAQAEAAALGALRDMSTLRASFQLAAEWERFALHGTGGLCTQGLALLCAFRDQAGAGRAAAVQTALEDQLETMAEMARLVRDAHAAEAEATGMCVEEQALRALNHVFFVQHEFRCVLTNEDGASPGGLRVAGGGGVEDVAPASAAVEALEPLEVFPRAHPGSGQRTVPGAHRGHLYQRPLTPALLCPDQVLQERRGTPLTVAALYSAVADRVGVEVQVFALPRSESVLLGVPVGGQKEDYDAEQDWWVVDLQTNGSFASVTKSMLLASLPRQAGRLPSGEEEEEEEKKKKKKTELPALSSLDLLVILCQNLVHSFAAEDTNTSFNVQQHRYADLITDLQSLRDASAEPNVDSRPARAQPQGRRRLVRRFHSGPAVSWSSSSSSSAAAAATPPPTTDFNLFAAPVRLVRLLDDQPNGQSDESHTTTHELTERLATRAIELYDACWQSAPEGVLESSPLAGGWRTAANAMFFRQQVDYTRESGYTSHLPGFEELPEFQLMLSRLRSLSASYLVGIGPETGAGAGAGVDAGAGGTAASADDVAAEFCRSAKLYCWASVHTGGSGHPPHVHSDSAVTGTFYAQRPAGTAPIVFDDPRGTSPFDVLAGVESELRFGLKSLTSAPPPFDRGFTVAPARGDVLFFPPWLVHSVPAVDPAGPGAGQVRVSFSFNMRGPWSLTAGPKGRVCT